VHLPVPSLYVRHSRAVSKARGSLFRRPGVFDLDQITVDATAFQTDVLFMDYETLNIPPLMSERTTMIRILDREGDGVGGATTAQCHTTTTAVQLGSG